MKFTLFNCEANPISYYWQLDIGGEHLYKSQSVDSFINALRNLENFHLGLFSLPVIDENGDLLRPHQANAEYAHSLLLRVTPTEDKHWQWEICTLDAYPLTTFGSYDTRDQAINFVTALVQEIYSEAIVVDQHGCTPPVFSFSRHYRDVFGIADDHPSAYRDR